MKVSNRSKYIIIIIFLIFIVYTFIPFKIEKVLNRKINFHEIKSIEIINLVNAFTSNEYSIKETEQIIDFYKYLENLRVRRCIIVPEFYSIQPNKTYRITLIGINKVLVISINTDQVNEYITINNKTYIILPTETEHWIDNIKSLWSGVK
ncbi:MAG: hypothetical protein AAGU76_18405 [Sedimentibacter sp.]|uniref:hypothetical protein n=1 Tax=Sedimentibacter sp. TaxID=1960295 RepID=UPI00315889D0